MRADSSSPRRRGPIRRAVNRVDGVSGLVEPSRSCIKLPGLWVPAFAGTTLINFKSAASTVSPSRGTICPSFANHSPSNEGAGNVGCALHPRSRVRSRAKKAAHEHTGQRRTSDIPCAMALRLIRTLPGELRSVATVACERVRKLGASLAAPGPHDFAVRFDTARLHGL